MNYWDVQDGLKCYVALDSIAERGRAMRTFVCIVPVTRRRVTTDNGESVQRGEILCAGRLIRRLQRTRGLREG